MVVLSHAATDQTLPFPCLGLPASELSSLGRDAAPVATNGCAVALFLHFARRATLADTGSAHTQASHGLTRTLHPTLFCHRHHDLGPLATPAGSTVEQLVLGTRIAQHQAESLPCRPDRTQHGVTTIDDRPRS